MTHALRPVVLRPARILAPLPFSMLVHLLYQRELTTFRRPKTFTQLVVAKKLYDKNPTYVTTADKIASRGYVSKRIGDRYLIPMLQAVDNPEDIDFDGLRAPYVIKARHGYNMNIFVRRGDTVDRRAIITQTRRWMKANFYRNWKEWAYKDCPPGLIIEGFIGDNDKPPADYKMYVFSGKVGMIQVDHDRFEGHKVNIFDAGWNELDFSGTFPFMTPSPPRPCGLREMIQVAEKLGAGFDFCRVDLYNVNGRIYFGEITHYPGVGIVAHNPREFDVAIGKLWLYGTPFPSKFFKRRAAKAA